MESNLSKHLIVLHDALADGQKLSMSLGVKKVLNSFQ